jgi:serine/threonine protein kinase
MPVAIKLIGAAPTSARWSVLHARFVREARTLGRLRSEYVCRVLDFGTLEAGEPFVVLEFLQGEPLAIVAQSEHLAREAVVDFVAQAIAGLAEAHRCGLVHRDIKPSNLFIATVQGARRQTKVIDFGLVRGPASGGAGGVPDLGATVTRGDGLLGTPEFISPEQADSPHDVDGRSDVWSLGASLFWLLTRELPFEGATRLALLSSIVNDPPRMWLFEGTSVPKDLRELVAHALAKNPRDRPESVAALGDRLVPFCGPEGIRALDIARETLDLPVLASDDPPTERRAPKLELADATVSLDYRRGGPIPRSNDAREFPIPKIAKKAD